jgi:SynChlorMet cassette protein ScmD
VVHLEVGLVVVGAVVRKTEDICVKTGEKPLANPVAILREEFDDWAILYDPDTGHGFGLSPTGVFIWKLLDGGHTVDGLLEEIRGHAVDVPEEAANHIWTFVDALVAEGLAGLDGTGFGLLENTAMAGLRSEEYLYASIGGVSGVGRFTYEPPTLIDFTDGRQARGTTCSGHGSAGGSCGTGAGATTCCYSGTCGADPGNCSCSGGTCGYYNNSSCECTGSCPNPQQYCCFGDCATVCSRCSSGCCDSCCGYFCNVGRGCSDGCSA